MVIRVGPPDVAHDAAAHVAGIKAGNEPSAKPEPGLLPDGRSTARRSTGVNAGAEDPIDPSSPNLPPA